MMSIPVRAAACAATLGLMALAWPATAAELTLVTDAGWRVTTAAPSAGWNTDPGYDTSGWAAATELFPVAPLQPGIVAQAIWSAGGQYATTEVAIWGRRLIDLSAAPSLATLRGGIDDDGDVYVNGILVAASQNGYADGLGTVDLTPYLQAGTNVLAFSATDNWPVWGYNHHIWLQIDATLEGGGTVPEPASALLLAGGLGLLVATRRSATAMPRRRRGTGPRR